MNALTAPEGFLSYVEAEEAILAFEAEVMAATGMDRREIARADSTDLVTIHDCWLRARSDQENFR